MGVFAAFDHLRDVDSGPEQLQVLHNTIRVVLRQGDAKLSEHTHMSTFETKTSLQ